MVPLGVIMVMAAGNFVEQSEGGGPAFSEPSAPGLCDGCLFSPAKTLKWIVPSRASTMGAIGSSHSVHLDPAFESASGRVDSTPCGGVCGMALLACA